MPSKILLICSNDGGCPGRTRSKYLGEVRLDRARCEPHNDRATAEDRDVDRHAFNGASMHESDDDVSG
jgi:hypothetical protein